MQRDAAGADEGLLGSGDWSPRGQRSFGDG